MTRRLAIIPPHTRNLHAQPAVGIDAIDACAARGHASVSEDPWRHGRPSKRPAIGVWLPIAAILALITIATAFALAVVHHSRRLGAQRVAQMSVPASVEPTASEPLAASPSVATSGDQDRALAACHPHLVHAPDIVPQVDTTNVPLPGRLHMKIHLWVNGGGLVVRSQLVTADLGTEVEQQAAVGYMRGLHFEVPESLDCRSREIELIGDVFEAPTSSGDWVTLVRVYPRLSIDAGDALRTRD
jgi:hypothetical protein